MDSKSSHIDSSCTIGKNVKIIEPVNIYQSILGDQVFIGPFVEIGGARIGSRTKVSSHSYIPPGVEIGEDCFIGHGVMFTNDKFDKPQGDPNWICRPTVIGNQVRIGSGSVILPVKIGDRAIIGAGSVVTKDVLPNTIVCGNPARNLTRNE